MLVAICTKVVSGVCACMLTWKSFPGPALLSSLETLHKNSASLSKFEVHVSWPCSSNLIAFQISKRRGSETRMGGSLDGVLQPFSEHTEEA